MSDVARIGAAMRRRQRRQRSWWRFEHLSVAAALATVTHLSFQVGTKNDASSGQKTVTSAGGERPGVLTEPEPQWEAVTVGYVTAGGSSPGGVAAWCRRRHHRLLPPDREPQAAEGGEEEKERRRKREDAEHEARMQELD